MVSSFLLIFLLYILLKEMEYLPQNVPPGAFLLQYQGEIVTDKKKVERREERSKRERRGCFMYFFKMHNTTMW